MINKLIKNELKSERKLNKLHDMESGYEVCLEESLIDTSSCDSEKLIMYLTERSNDQCICKKLTIQSDLRFDGDLYKSGLNTTLTTCDRSGYCINTQQPDGKYVQVPPKREEIDLTYENTLFDKVEFPLSKLSHLYKLSDKNFNDLICANRVDFIFYELSQLTEYDIIIIDFEDINDISEVFIKKYFRYKLTSNFRIFEVNQNINIRRAFDKFILNLQNFPRS